MSQSILLPNPKEDWKAKFWSDLADIKRKHYPVGSPVHQAMNDPVRMTHNKGSSPTGRVLAVWDCKSHTYLKNI